MNSSEAKQRLLEAETVRCPKCGFTRVVKAFWNEPWHPRCIDARYNEPAIWCPKGCGYHTFRQEGDGGAWMFVDTLAAADFQMIGWDYVYNPLYNQR